MIYDIIFVISLLKYCLNLARVISRSHLPYSSFHFLSHNSGGSSFCQKHAMLIHYFDNLHRMKFTICAKSVNKDCKKDKTNKKSLAISHLYQCVSLRLVIQYPKHISLKAYYQTSSYPFHLFCSLPFLKL